jgi:hypothetical protein
MGKGAPSSPDPWATAGAQSASNQFSAGQNFWNQNVNETNPYGSKTYKQSGTTQVWDPFSKSYYNQPQYSSQVNLSPAEQGILDRNTAMRTNLGDLGVSQSARMKQLLSKNIDLSGAQGWQAAKAPGEIRQDQTPTDRKAVEDAMMERYKRYADPQNRAAEASMANRGLAPGSQGYGSMAQAQGDQFSNATREAYLASGDEARRAQAAYNQAEQQRYAEGTDWATQMNQLRQAQVSEAFAGRNQNYNEMAALAGLSPVNNPTFAQFNPSSVGDVPIGQYIYDDFNARSKQASDRMSGITGVASAVAGALPWASWLSDRRAKTDIRPIGSSLAGVPLYTFRYWKKPLKIHVGVIADEAKAIHPDAVHMSPKDGYDYVDYGMLRRRHMG